MVMTKSITNCSKPASEWKDGEQKTIVDMTPKEVTKKLAEIEESKLETIKEMRGKRDRLLAETDFTQISDAPFTSSKKSEYVLYRQALRDLPQAYPTGDNVIWPNKPT